MLTISRKLVPCFRQLKAATGRPSCPVPAVSIHSPRLAPALPDRTSVAMRGSGALASLLARRLARKANPASDGGALAQLQRGLTTQTPFLRAGGSAAAARAPWLVAVAAGLSAGLGVQLVSAGGEPAECKAADKPAKLKEFDKEEVAKHRSKETGGLQGQGVQRFLCQRSNRAFPSPRWRSSWVRFCGPGALPPTCS